MKFLNLCTSNSKYMPYGIGVDRNIRILLGSYSLPSFDDS